MIFGKKLQYIDIIKTSFEKFNCVTTRIHWNITKMFNFNPCCFLFLKISFIAIIGFLDLKTVHTLWVQKSHN